MRSAISSWTGRCTTATRSKENITPETGCKQGSIMGRRDGIVTRGVLYDMPQMKGVEWIEPGTPITRADLEAWEKRSACALVRAT